MFCAFWIEEGSVNVVVYLGCSFVVEDLGRCLLVFLRGDCRVRFLSRAGDQSSTEEGQCCS